MQVRVVDDELEPEIRCAWWMAVKGDIASVDAVTSTVSFPRHPTLPTSTSERRPTGTNVKTTTMRKTCTVRLFPSYSNTEQENYLFKIVHGTECWYST